MKITFVNCLILAAAAVIAFFVAISIMDLGVPDIFSGFVGKGIALALVGVVWFFIFKKGGK